MFPLIGREKVRPELNPMDHHANNLQKISTRCSVKNKIVSTIPYGPTKRRNTNANSILVSLVDTIEPSPKHIVDIRGRRDIKRKVSHSPNNLSKGTR
jgi:hypothetical protein